MPVKITFDTATVAAKITGAVGQALKSVKPQMIADCNEFCPKDDGTLRRSAETQSHVMEYFGETELRLVWSTPYARLLYYGIVMVDPKTKAAGFQNEFGEWRSRKNIRKELSNPPREFHYHTAGTGKLWCESARNVYSDDWRLIIQNAMREGLK